MAAKVVQRSMGMMRHVTRMRQNLAYSAMKKIGTLDEKIHRTTHQQPTRKLGVLLKDGAGDRQGLLEDQDWTEADIAGITDEQQEAYIAGLIYGYREAYSIETVVIKQIADAVASSVAQQQDILKIKDEAVGILVDIDEEDQRPEGEEGIDEVAKVTDFLRASEEAGSEREAIVAASEEVRRQKKVNVADYQELVEDGCGEKKSKGRLRRIGSYLRNKFTSRRKYKQL